MRSVKDHLGNGYTTIKEMLAAYGVPRQVYDSRRRQGCNLEECLTGNFEKMAAEESGSAVRKLIRREERELIINFYKELGLEPKRGFDFVEDHLGNSYSSASEMCREYKISLDSYNTKLVTGCDMSICLSKESCRSGIKVVKDHKGTLYGSIDEMISAYCISKELFLERQAKLRSLEFCLTGRNTTCMGVIFDHVGRPYNSVEQMCLTYGIPCYYFIKKLSNGCSVGDSLSIRLYKSEVRSVLNADVGAKRKSIETVKTSNVVKKPVGIKDFLGNKFKGVSEACSYWHLDEESFRQFMQRFGNMGVTVIALTRVSVVMDGKIYENYVEYCDSVGADFRVFIQYLQQGYDWDASLRGAISWE